MKPGFTTLAYRFCLTEVYEKVHQISERSPFRGRLLALPLALIIFFTIPIEKAASFFESLLFAIANLFQPLFPKYCSFYDGWVSLKRACVYAIGLIFCPITALLASCAVFVSVLNDPAAATKKFIESCHR